MSGWYYRKELRKEYDTLNMYKKFAKEAKLDKITTNTLIRNTKKRIRLINKAYDGYVNEPQWRLPFGYSDDSYYDSRAMFYIEDYVVDDVTEYKDEHWEHWYNPWGDGRDCTGVWFTSYIKVFPLPKCGKTIVYHVQGCDL